MADRTVGNARIIETTGLPEGFVPPDMSPDRPAVNYAVDHPDDSDTKRQYRRNLRDARDRVAGLEEILRTWED